VIEAGTRYSRNIKEVPFAAPSVLAQPSIKPSTAALPWLEITCSGRRGTAAAFIGTDISQNGVPSSVAKQCDKTPRMISDGQYQRPREKPPRLSDVKKMFREMKAIVG
jgi:hypothetical protein